jgi:hypothetical protein
MSSMITPAWLEGRRSELAQDDKLTDEQHLRASRGASADL